MKHNLLELIGNGLVDRDNQNHYSITSKGEKYLDMFMKIHKNTHAIIVSVS
jgi:predicted transcriptional regulator